MASAGRSAATSAVHAAVAKSAAAACCAAAQSAPACRPSSRRGCAAWAKSSGTVVAASAGDSVGGLARHASPAHSAPTSARVSGAGCCRACATAAASAVSASSSDTAASSSTCRRERSGGCRSIACVPRKGCCSGGPVRARAPTWAAIAASAAAWASPSSVSSPSSAIAGGGAPLPMKPTISASARKGVCPEGGSAACSSSAMRLSSSRVRRSRAGSPTSGKACALADSVRPSSSASAFLLAVRECSSRQTSRSPAFTRRSCTTESAAIFSATNSTDLPSCAAAAIRLVMVCDLPVPGGPCTTRLAPWRTSSMTLVCEASASTTWMMRAGSSSASRRSCGPKSGASASKPSASRPCSRGLAANAPSGQFAGSRSRCISSLAKEKKPSCMPSASTDQPRWPAVASRTRAKYCAGVQPSASSTSGRPIAKSWRRRSCSGRLVLRSSSRQTRSKVELRSLRTSCTGSSTSGASRTTSEEGASFQRRKPSAR